MQAFAAAHINDVWIGTSNRNGADGLRGLIVENGSPSAAVVIGLPYAAVHGAHIENIRLSGDAGCGARPAAAKRTDHSPVQFLVNILRNLGVDGNQRKENQDRHRRSS